jgi:hypothetical protein
MELAAVIYYYSRQSTVTRGFDHLLRDNARQIMAHAQEGEMIMRYLLDGSRHAALPTTPQYD